MLRPSDSDAVTVNVILVLQVAAGLYVGGSLLFLLWLRPGFGMLFWGLLFGALAGLAYSFLLQSNRYEKRLLNDGVHTRQNLLRAHTHQYNNMKTFRFSARSST